MNKYELEISKSLNSEKFFKEFKKDLKIVSPYGTSQEELFIGYYRAMQLWLFKDISKERMVIYTALSIGKVATIKLIQKNIGEKEDGVFGPITRGSLDKFKLDDFIQETSKLKYTLIKIYRWIFKKIN